MLLEKLPLELIQHILELALQDSKLRTLTALLGVNSISETEVAKLYLRKLGDIKSRAAYWSRVPFPLRRRMARDIIMSQPGIASKRTIANYMNAVATYLMRYAEDHDPSGTGRFSRAYWLHNIASVLAPSDADCRCGKPAFLHSKCYSLFSVPDTAFHIAILKKHTNLEIAMIADGMGEHSVCPYLKVSKKDPTCTRRTALEWACAHQLEDTVRRLVAAAERALKKPEDYLPTAAAVCAATRDPYRDASLLRFLLDHLFIISWARHSDGPIFTYQSRLISFKHWNRIVLANLARHKARKTRSTIYEMRRHYPYLEFGSTLNLLPYNFCRELFGYTRIIRQRPFCKIFNANAFSTILSDESDRESFVDTTGPDAEWKRHWHLVSCSPEACLHRCNKAHPMCKQCGRRHVYDLEGRDTYDWDGFSRSARYVENVVGLRPGSIRRC
ncbi:hypothetical protein SVAN01_02759 [Stagonosporopsis vannaccii]|nr:hypothetical protein SVAN01_02759 [Stagonosporopsis vannaccii]